MQLGKSMGEHSLHIMTMSQKTPVFTNFIQASFTPRVDADPVAACAELLQLDSTNVLFDAGVNVVECEDIATFNTSNVFADGALCRRFNWDTTTAHIAAPDCTALDLTHFDDNPKIYDICHQPNMFSTVTGQTTQHDFLAALPGKLHLYIFSYASFPLTNSIEEDRAQYDIADDDLTNMDDNFNFEDFFMPTAFDEDFPSFDLD